MCGRFTLDATDLEELARLSGAEFDHTLAEYYRPRYNVAPLQHAWIVRTEREDRVLERARFGLVNVWAKDNKRAAMQINARSESVRERPAYRAAFKARRCLVPATGFYEWSGPKAARVPHWIHPAEGRLWLFAGLYEDWHPDPGVDDRTFTILTTDANATIAPIHDRMPVILDEDSAEQWLFAPAEEVERLATLLVPAAPSALIIDDANPAVNSVRNDGPQLIRVR